MNLSKKSWQIGHNQTLAVLVLLGCIEFELVAPAKAQSTPPSLISGHLSSLDKSERTWRQWRQKIKGNYHYKVNFQSKVGFSDLTTIRVVNNRVVERSFTFTPGVQLVGRKGGTIPLTISWTERGTQVGTRVESATPALTLEELYSRCRVLLLSEPWQAPAELIAEWTLPVLIFDHRGILQSCFTQNTKIRGDGLTRGVSGIELHIE